MPGSCGIMMQGTQAMWYDADWPSTCGFDEAVAKGV